MNIEVDKKELEAIKSGLHTRWINSSKDGDEYSKFLWSLLQRLRKVEEGADAMAGQPAYSESQGWNLTGEDDGGT